MISNAGAASGVPGLSGRHVRRKNGFSPGVIKGLIVVKGSDLVSENRREEGITMSVATDIERIIVQERQLVFDGFNPEIALALGLDIKARAEDMGQAVAIDVRFWERQLFWFAMSGTTADNAEWVRRKVNLVRRFHKSSYRMLLERGGEGVMQPQWGLDYSKYVFAGGGFPIFVEGVGAVGSVTVSGLPGRDDHGLVVEALCAATGADYELLALPRQ